MSSLDVDGIMKQVRNEVRRMKEKKQENFFEYENGFEETEKPTIDWGAVTSEIESFVDERDCLKCTTHKRAINILR